MAVHVQLDTRCSCEGIAHENSVAQRTLQPIGRSPIALGAPPYRALARSARELPPLQGTLVMRGRHLCFVLAFLLPVLVAAVPSPGTAVAHQSTASSPPSTHALRPHVVLMPTSKRPPLLQTLSLWTPRTVRAHGIVTVVAQVNTPGAAVWLATRFGMGPVQERQEVASARGLVVTRLQALVPARCTGYTAARVYATATAGERAMTRAATFMVACPRAHVQYPSRG
jgi:hypothetical protein